MSRDPALSTVNCTACGAGLSVHGGGRVLTHVCSYCGTLLDAQDNYRALAKFSDLPRPDSPLKIGMAGDVQGVSFTVIGTLGRVERYQGREWRWVEHQIYSPSHGYAWITYEDGHLIFTRKVRRSPNPAWMTARQVNAAETRPSVLWNGARYSYYDSGASETVFAEGEFNWTPNKGDRSYAINLASEDGMISYVSNGAEREYEYSTYLPFTETLTAFGAKATTPRRAHVLEPTPAGYRGDWYSQVMVMLALIAFLGGAILSATPDRVLDQTRFSFADFPVEIPLTLTNAGHLVEITFAANVNNSWAALEMELTDPEDVVLFTAERGMEYYHGWDDGKWSEGSGAATLTFRPTIPGTYTLSLENPVAEVDWPGGRQATHLAVSAAEGVRAPGWLFAAGVVLLIMAAVPLALRKLHDRRRWAGSDWTDEDD